MDRKIRAQLDEIGARCDIETPHVQQVAALAATLFDGFARDHGLPSRDRDLLEAAALLHDIAYAAEPDTHEEHGVRFLEDHPVPGFTDSERAVVLAVILLHRPNWKPLADHPVLQRLSDRDRTRAVRLAALLRVADGLDHSHLQDALITACRPARQGDELTARCRWYSGNLFRARKKADLWTEAFGRPLTVSGSVQAQKTPFDGLLRKGDSALTCARRILTSQILLLRDSAAAIRQTSDPEPLHDFRVALRRFRTALRVFRPLLRKAETAELERSLRTLSRRLGPVRDLQVYDRFLEKSAAGDLRDALKPDLERATQLSCRILDSAFCKNALRRARHLVRADLPRLERTTAAPDGRAYLKKQLAKQLRRIRQIDPRRLEHDAQALHPARKRIRRARYTAEFAAPLRGSQTRRTMRRLKKLAGALGKIRDARRHEQRLKTATAAPPLMDRLQRIQEKKFQSVRRLLTAKK